MAKAILDGPYKKDALVPSTPWLDKVSPAKPVINIINDQDKITISWTHPDEKDVFRWVVYHQYGNEWTYTLLDRKKKELTLDKYRVANNTKLGLEKISVTAVDRTGNETERSEVAINK
jgi:hypothetical protein